jgi:hypothetical protein
MQHLTFVLVKFFFFIMAIYMLLLPAVPCSDVHKNSIENKQTELAHNQGHNHEQDAGDGCSPFCTCSCCSIAVIAHSFKPFEFETITTTFPIVAKFALCDIAFVSNFFGNIWQPPKIVVQF